MSDKTPTTISQPKWKGERLELTIGSNGSSQRMTLTEKTLAELREKDNELYAVIEPLFAQRKIDCANGTHCPPKESKKKAPKPKVKVTKEHPTPVVTIAMLAEEIKKIKNASIKQEKTGSFKIHAGRNLYYLKDSTKFGFLVGWNELEKKSMHIESKAQLAKIVAQIKEYANKE